MSGKVRKDILDYMKAQQYVSSHDALDYVYYGAPGLTDAEEQQFEDDFDATLVYFLTHVEAIPEPQ